MSNGYWTMLRRFFVAVPHQKRPYVVYPENENEDVGGYQDLAMVWEVANQADAERLLNATDERPGGQARHQAGAIATLVRGELIEQGVLDETETERVSAV